MKTHIISSPLITSDNIDSSLMSIDASGIDMATYFLRDKIYSNKILAVVREYVCNAIDEHDKHGISKPVEISLKSNVFSVRDFASGLSEYDVRNIFGMYFKSTKTNTNNQIGGFGIGSKAGHCYTDSFFVKSYFQGVCTTYICSLGGGSKGVPVGQVLKMAEEETQESGLEISLEVKSNDISSFDNTIIGFVKDSCKNISYISNYSTTLPDEYVVKKDFENFSIRLYKDNSYYHSNTVVVKMGDVRYNTTRLSDFLYGTSYKQGSLITGHYLVIDVDIGKLSLPISRESFEDTEANNKFLNKIKQEINEFIDKDLAQYKDYTVQQIYADLYNHIVSGQFFCLHKQHVYGELYTSMSNIGKTGYSGNTMTLKDKHLVAVIEDKDSFSYWVNKLSIHMSTIASRVYYINERFLKNPDIVKKLEEIFIFKKIKSTCFKWVKTPKSQEDFDTEYKVNLRDGSYSSYSDFFNALELHNKCCSLTYKPQATCKEDALKALTNMKFDTEDQLRYFSIYHGPPSSSFRVSCQNRKMVDNMKQIGWIEVYSDEWNKKVAEIRKNQEIKRIRDEKKESCALHFLKSEHNFQSRLIKKDKYLEKACKILQAIRNEKSLRATIFRALENQGYSYYNKGTINRKELRKILTING